MPPLSALVLLVGSLVTGRGAASEKTPANAKGSALFRDQVKPILLQHCLGCHGPDKKKGDLDISRRATLLEGGANGPALIPGKAEASLLFKKVASGKMPPKGPLSAKEIAALKQWIDAGAVYEQEPLVPLAKKDVVTPWSFHPLTKPTPPTTKFDRLVANPVDRFLFQKLEARGLAPSPIADRLVLLRRVTLDLTGLPPTLAEVEGFLKDTSADAYDKVVDRLLASPAYGERWARHWLDVVRFGESHGYEQNHIRPNAWPYRDYVIRAFNEDKPFDRFIAEQLAGDVLAKGDPNIEAATGFLVAGVHDTVGNQAEEGSRQQRADDLEDMVATVGAAFLGLTVNCAKCHDHKFDPIPQQDYYHLAAVFAGVRHGERQLGTVTGDDKSAKSLRDLQHKIRTLRGQVDDLDARARSRILAKQGVQPVPRPAVNTRRNVEEFTAVKARFIRFTVLATKDGSEPCLDEVEVYGADAKVNLAASTHGARATASSLLPGYKIHQVAHLNDGLVGNEWSWISNQRSRGWAQIELPEAVTIARIVWSRDGTDAPAFTDRLAMNYQIEVSLDGAKWTTVADGRDRAAAPEAISLDTLSNALTPEERTQRQSLQRELESWRNKAGRGNAMVYTGQFTAPDAIHLLKRGDVMQRGAIVGPAAPSQVAHNPRDLEPELIKTESGRRLALAKWITGPKNPLTARVLVNRVWQYHFGRGLVATPSDFGNNGSRPSHPELLDWLANDFSAGGWKLKRLHKLLVTSYAYRQSSQTTKQGELLDADNLAVWRMPLRRLEGEALRDGILTVSGKLDLTMGGPGFLLYKYRVVNVAIYEPLDEQGPQTWRRTIYATSARAIRETMLANFDCPECAQRTPRRDITTTPLQALSLLNGSFTTQQATFFSQRVAMEAGQQCEDQVKHAFRLAFGRPPNQRELQGATALVERHGLAALCRALFNANEFLYY